ncbi:ABC transporter permease subunit [Mumia zhuanghuii]|uniref:Transport permease protein n=2 Tax=Mumia TaxID=1546255 RepID=A0ABW1QP26_9ACTN|nr:MULTISPECIES: ABC transporter permease [Mumia]KAA1422135.1 ABC transporter permease subunit [Mumia zhuanghuii]
MTGRITAAIAARVLGQLRHDHRTMALMLVVPCALITLLWWVYSGNSDLFDTIGPQLLGVFGLVVMFLVTSITTLSERTSGTLERLFTLPMGKLDFLLGYALAFGAVALVQGFLAAGLSVWVLGLDVRGGVGPLVLVAVLSGVLGTALGLLVSAFAATEFQAVQFMPAFVLPQLLVCGLLVPRDELPQVLEWVSYATPLSYAVDATTEVTLHAQWTTALTWDVVALLAFTVGGLLLGSATLRRRTP